MVFFSLTGAHFGELQDLFLIDPYLLRFFLFKIGISYLSSMFEKVPASLLIMRLASDCLPVIKVSGMCDGDYNDGNCTKLFALLRYKCISIILV